MSLTTTTPVESSSDRLEILQLTSSLGLLIDARDWDGLRDLFVDRIDFDYTSLFGGTPQTIAASDLLEGWRVVESLDATQHLIGNQVVELEVDGAESNRAWCAANVQATHVSAGAIGDPAFTVGGRYDIGLRRTTDGWRISALKLTVLWTTGNRNVLPIADAADDD